MNYNYHGIDFSDTPCEPPQSPEMKSVSDDVKGLKKNIDALLDAFYQKHGRNAMVEVTSHYLSCMRQPSIEVKLIVK